MKKKTNKKTDQSQVTGAVYANSFKPLAPWINSTGFRTNALRYRALDNSNEARIAEEFLLNSRLRRNDRETEISIGSYLFDSNIAMVSMIGHEKRMGICSVNLPPKGAKLRLELGETINWRRSTRIFTGDTMRFDYLASMVRGAAGITCHVEADLSSGDHRTLHFRTTSSAGGLYPIELYLAVLNVEDLNRGIYRYDPIKDLLWQTGREKDLENLLHSFNVPEEMISISRANVVFLLVGIPWRTMRKYGNRGMRFLFLEAGSIAQNINLVTVALGLGGVECGSFYDDEAHEAMNFDGLYQTLLHTVIVGFPS